MPKTSPRKSSPRSKSAPKAPAGKAPAGKAPAGKAPARKAPARKRSAAAPGSPKSASPPSASEPKALPPPPTEPGGERTLPFEIDPRRIEEGLKRLREEVVHWANKGRYTKVRFKFRGKQLLPDLPLAAVVAAESLTFYWVGILRALLVTVAGGSLLQVELVNDADKRVQAGREALLSGDVEAALTCFREALAMDRDHAPAYLNLGVALKLQGDKAGALAAFERAKALDAEGPVGLEAERLAAPLRPQGATQQG